MIYSLIWSVWVMSPKSSQGHLNFFLWPTLYFITESNIKSFSKHYN